MLPPAAPPSHLKKKYNVDGSLDKFKARLVYNGKMQKRLQWSSYTGHAHRRACVHARKT
jgi:hypothetical protein